jgi:hypothetical protein
MAALRTFSYQLEEQNAVAVFLRSKLVTRTWFQGCAADSVTAYSNIGP